MKAHIERAQQSLGELGALSAKTEAAERRILERAEQRREEVQAAIDRARTGVECAPDSSQDRYLALIEERGRLDTVISRAREALGM